MPRPRDGRAHEKTAECKNRMKNWGEGEKLRRVFLLRVNTALRITVGGGKGGRSLETTGETSDLEGGRRWPAVAGIRDFRQALRWGGERDGGQHRGFWSEAGPTERLHCSRRLIHCRSPHPAANRLSPLAPPFFDPLPPPSSRALSILSNVALQPNRSRNRMVGESMPILRRWMLLATAPPPSPPLLHG